MLIYHYSKDKYSELLTLEKQKNIPKDEREFARSAMLTGKRAGMYFEHISFFIDPIPVDIIAGVFGGQHPVWKSGSTLYQYTVETSMIPKFNYEIVESPEKTELLYDDSVSDDEYLRLLKQVYLEKDYVGSGSVRLVKACKPLLGCTREFYEKLPTRPNFDKIKDKYAATVPHLMLYPKGGVIHYRSVSTVKIT